MAKIQDKESARNTSKNDAGGEKDEEKIDWEHLKIPGEIIALVPYEAANKYKFIPFEKEGHVLRVAVTDIDSVEVQNALQFLAEKNQLSIEMIPIDEKDFEAALVGYTNPSFTIQQALETIGEEEKPVEKKEEKSSDVTVQEAPVAKIVEVILRNAIEGSASDIHIEPMEDNVRVRYRLDGILHNSLILPKQIGPAIASRIKILSNLKIDEKRKPQDGRFRITESKKQIDLRVSTLPVSMGEKVVMRVLDKEKGLLDLEDLGVVGRSYDIIKKSVFEPYGMILITGPTGSGKSTTLYSVLKILNKEGVNIITLEDPVEYAIEGINQSQVKPEIGYSFASGLRSILRQDPDIIMVGEIRDTETAELAVHAALTGHVVLATLHTNDSLGAIPRLIDMKVEPFLVASSLRAVVAQRLVRKICPNCREEVKMSDPVKLEIERVLAQIPEAEKKVHNLQDGIKIYKGKGCAKCTGSGMKGRIGIFEVFYVDEEVNDLLGGQVDEEKLRQIAHKQGMITMKQDGILKVLEGHTTLEEVERVTEEGFLEIE
ncbi:MAG TPA: GspE/PulE family protein [Candidatus Bathyarchaeia archaeon]|nr:GspE/PulE family protein [Candidatus Bathyarchaeia archaeon]